MGTTLRRYSSTLAMLDTLVHRRIALLNPRSWSDQNDREVMAYFAESVSGGRVFAYCMVEGNETAHHWQVFADRGSGACIKFDRDRFLGAVADNPCVRHRAVSYVQWKDLGASTPATTNLPFIKRSVFRFEKEYRLIATPPVSACSDMTYDIEIPLSCITSVYVSGEVPEPHFQTLKGLIAAIPGCRSLKVRHSGLLKNPNWSRSLLAATGS
jgi:hypothetical protein